MAIKRLSAAFLASAAFLTAAVVYAGRFENASFTDISGNYNQAGIKAGSANFENSASIEETGSSSEDSASGSGRGGTQGRGPVPARINDLTVTAVSSYSAALEWTAPAGDWERSSDDVTRYILRFSSITPILTGEDFLHATEYSQNWIPLPKGTLESHVVYGLDADTTYYFVIESANKHIVRSERSVQASTCTLRPAAPVSPSVAAVYRSSITVTWGDVNPTVGYVLEASTAPDFTAPIYSSSTVSAGPFSLSVQSLALNTTYYLRVGAVRGGTTSYALTTPISTSTLTNEPGTATPVFLDVQTSVIATQWDAGAPPNPSGTTYVLEASSTAFQAGTTLVSTSTAQFLYAFAGMLLPDTTYQFRVKSVNFNGVPSSPALLGSTSTLAVPPQAVNITAINFTSATVTWQPGNSQGYRLEISSTNFDGTGIIYSSATVNSAVSSLSIQGLVSNTLYRARVGAYNWNSVLNYSVTTASSTLSAPASSPQFAGVFSSSVAVTWQGLPTSPQQQTAEGYRLEASTAADFTGQIYFSSTTDIALSTLTVSGLGPAATYYFRIGTLNWDGRPNYILAGSTLTAMPALAIANFRGWTEFKKARLAWDDIPAEAKTYLFVRYRIHRSTTQGDIGLLLSTTAANAYTDADVIIGATYYYQASVELSGGYEVAQTSQIAVYVTGVPPAPPLDLTLTASSGTVSLAWLAPIIFSNSVPFDNKSEPEFPHEISGYTVYRSTLPRGAYWAAVASLSSSTLTWSDVAGSGEYYYCVKAGNSAGVSKPSIIRAKNSLRAYAVAADNRSMLEIPGEYVRPFASGAVNSASAFELKVTSHPEDLGGRVLKSLEFSVYRGGITPETVNLDGWALLHISYRQAGMLVVPSGVSPPLTRPEDVIPVPEQISVYWHNGAKWIQLYGKVDEANQEIVVKTSMLGRYQIRSVERVEAFNMDKSGLSNRLLTPNGDGKNDTVVFVFDNPRDSAVTGKIFELKGAFVADMKSGPISNSLEWDGKANGQAVSGGVYIYQIEAEGKVTTGTIAVIR